MTIQKTCKSHILRHSISLMLVFLTLKDITLQTGNGAFLNVFLNRRSGTEEIISIHDCCTDILKSIYALEI